MQPEYKICRTCCESKCVDDFYSSAAYGKSGKDSQCKKCKIKSNSLRQQTQTVKDRRSAALKEKWANDPAFRQRRNKEQFDRYQTLTDEQKQKNAEKSKARREANLERTRELSRASYQRRKTDPAFLASARVRAGIRHVLAGGQKTSRVFVNLGYSPDDLAAHLQKQFLPGMDWSNFGEWHIDHIVPLAALRPSSEQEVAAAWRLSNLRPLWAADNFKKKAKLLFLV